MEVAGDGGRRRNLGGSLRVANVQALAAASNDLAGEIPHRYIRPEIEVEPLLDADSDEIPVVDLSRLLDPQFSDDEATMLNFASEEWGFFQLVNHGISDELIERMKVDIMAFFQLPLEVKEAFAQLPGDTEGYGQIFVVSEDQKLDWADMVLLITQPLSYRNMKLWPTRPPTFWATLDKYSAEVKRVANCLLGSMAKSLGLDPEKLIDMFREGNQSMRINYYPPCPYTNKVLGLSPHSDATGLTLLLQVNEVQGLQIKKNGGWVPIKPLPGAFIVNIGDILEVLSNGKYKSIEHRVTINMEKERLSIVAFHNLTYGDRVSPLPELVKEGKEYYKNVRLEDYMRIYFSHKLDGKSALDHMKLKM